MNTIFKMAAAAAVCFGMAGCNEYFHEINWPHGALTEEDLNRDNLRQGSMIPTMEMLIVPHSDNGAFQHCESLVGDVWGRTLMSKPGGNGDSWKGDLSWFYPDGDQWLSNPFTATLAFYRPYVETWGFTNHDSNNSVWALARIMRVASMHRLADMYGPIPYTKIDPTDLDLYIPYDTEETVWTTMLEDLNTAIDDLHTCIVNQGFSDITNFDRIYQSNANQWFRYANSLLLRLAVRVSNVRPDLTRLYAQKAIDGGVIESNSDNAMLNMRIGRMTDIGSKLYVMAHNYNDTFAAADLVCYMDGYNDGRRSAYFTTYNHTNQQTGVTTPVYAGLRAGSKGKDTAVREICSRPAVGQYDNYPLLTAAEVAFLRAECVLNGWTSDSKTAQGFYEEGIRLSFNQWGAAGAEGYLADGESKPADFVDYLGNGEDTSAPSSITVAWENDGKELQRIITQKYIALYPLGHEVWCDYRRTGFPEFLPVVSGKASASYSNMKVANRLKFSVNESQTNKENLAEAVTFLNGGDDYSTKLWWAK